jgi:hypothetical protein
MSKYNNIKEDINQKIKQKRDEDKNGEHEHI